MRVEWRDGWKNEERGGLLTCTYVKRQREGEEAADSQERQGCY